MLRPIITILKFNFLVVMKYSRFLQSIQISTIIAAPFMKQCYSSNVQIIASISLSYILQLCSIGERNLLRKMTRCYLLSSWKTQNSISPVAKSELSALMQNRAEVSREISTDATVITSLSILKTAYYMAFQAQILLLPVTLRRK